MATDGYMSDGGTNHDEKGEGRKSVAAMGKGKASAASELHHKLTAKERARGGKFQRRAARTSAANLELARGAGPGRACAEVRP